VRHKEANKPVHRPFLRKIHFGDDEVWTYRVTSMFVLIREPDPTKLHRVSLMDLTGMWPHDIERGMWKKWWKGIGPGQIRTHIELHLRGDVSIALPATVVLDDPPPGNTRRWHLRYECSLHGRTQRGVTPEEAAAQLKTPLTLLNLCGTCRRISLRKAA
jgi:hypothetical protein